MNEKKEYGWKLKEIILVAMICIVFGVVYLGGVYLASFLSTLLTPVGLAPLANEIVFGIWFMAAILAAIFFKSLVYASLPRCWRLDRGPAGKYVRPYGHRRWDRPGAGGRLSLLWDAIASSIQKCFTWPPRLLRHQLFVELRPLRLRPAGGSSADHHVPDPPGQHPDLLRLITKPSGDGWRKPDC